jgi:hypothetical protein
MRPRALGLLLLAAAALLHAGVTLPAAARVRATQEEQARLLDERRQAESRLASIALRQEARARALAAVAEPSLEPDRAAARLRRTLVEALAEQPLGDVHLSVRAGNAPVSAVARIRARGPFQDVMALSTRLLDAESGLVVEKARFGAGSGGVDTELSLASIGGGQ